MVEDELPENEAEESDEEKAIRAYMDEHPDIVAKVAEKYGIEEEDSGEETDA